METHRYEILWIDDEYKKLEAFIINAELQGIDLFCYATSKKGMDAFEKDLTRWDGIILDAKCWEESSDEVAKTDGMYKSIRKINELRHKRDVPIFIFSGQPDLLSNEQFHSSLSGIKCYQKGSPIETKQLFSDIKQKADLLPETQIKHRYADVIHLFDELSPELLEILSYVDHNKTNDAAVFNNIRKVLEWVMEYCIQHGVLPLTFTGTKLGDCSKFLGKREMAEVVPPYIQRSFHSSVNISNEGSHRMATDQDVRDGKAPYLIRSTVFEMLNIIYWCKSLPNDEASINAIREKSINLTGQ